MNKIKPVMNEDEATYSPPTQEMSFSIRAPAGRTIRGMTFRRTTDGGITVVCQTRPASEFTLEDVEMLRAAYGDIEDEGQAYFAKGRFDRLAARVEAQLLHEAK